MCFRAVCVGRLAPLGQHSEGLLEPPNHRLFALFGTVAERGDVARSTLLEHGARLTRDHLMMVLALVLVLGPVSVMVVVAVVVEVLVVVAVVVLVACGVAVAASVPPRNTLA